jgi:hypothetical protein
MQGGDAPELAHEPLTGTWELAVENGVYAVEVGAGDAARGTGVGGAHTINVEGSTAIDRFEGDATQENQW